MKYLAFILFSIILILISCSKKGDKNPLTQTETVTISLPTANCSICKEILKKTIYDIEGVKQVEIDIEKKIAIVKFVPFQTNLETIEIIITDAGYDANQRKRNSFAYENLPNCCKEKSDF